ncbi:MAG TPA: hypothetical protein PLC48_05585 [Ferruginibacter sp.]|nr:hypothetical protein [Ferruginibacter sp.]
MKKFTCMLMLIVSINGELIAQENSPNNQKVFGFPVEKMTRRFYFDLGKGNTMQLELEELDDLPRIRIDSLLRIMLVDADALKYKGSELSSRNIDYVFESSGANKIRIREIRQAGTSYVIDQGNPSLLKTEQDSVFIMGKVPSGNKAHHYRLSFYLNDLSDLTSYPDFKLAEKFENIYNSKPQRWNTEKGRTYLPNDKTVSSKQAKGRFMGYDYLNIRLSADIQNYKNNFVPSITLGAVFDISSNRFRHAFGFWGEYHFSFEKNAEGKLQTFGNKFISLSYQRTSINENDKKTFFNPNISFGILTKRKGEMYDKGTMKIGAGKFTMSSGRTSLEPIIYFTDFFKQVSPGIRLVQSF